MKLATLLGPLCSPHADVKSRARVEDVVQRSIASQNAPWSRQPEQAKLVADKYFTARLNDQTSLQRPFVRVAPGDVPSHFAMTQLGGVTYDTPNPLTKAHALQRTIYPAFSDPLHNIALYFEAFPSVPVAARSIKAAVADAVANQLIPPEIAPTLEQSLRRDLAESLAVASKVGELTKGLQFVAQHQLVEGKAVGRTDKDNAALLIKSTLLQTGRPDIVVQGATLEHCLDAYRKMPELILLCNQGLLTRECTTRHINQNRHSEAARVMTGPGKPMQRITEAFIDFSTAHRPAKASVLHAPFTSPRKPGPANIFDTTHSHEGNKIPPGSDIKALMDKAAKSWKPTNDPVEVAYRYALLMHAYSKFFPAGESSDATQSKGATASLTSETPSRTQLPVQPRVQTQTPVQAQAQAQAQAKPQAQPRAQQLARPQAEPQMQPQAQLRKQQQLALRSQLAGQAQAAPEPAPTLKSTVEHLDRLYEQSRRGSAMQSASDAPTAFTGESQEISWPKMPPVQIVGADVPNVQSTRF